LRQLGGDAPRAAAGGCHAPTSGGGRDRRLDSSRNPAPAAPDGARQPRRRPTAPDRSQGPPRSLIGVVITAMSKDLWRLGEQYAGAPIDPEDCDPDPIVEFGRWFQRA